MAAHAAAQEEGEWTIFALTVGAVVISMVGDRRRSSPRPRTCMEASKALHVGLVAVTLLLTWLMTAGHLRVSLRARILFEVSGDGPEVDGGLNFPGRGTSGLHGFPVFRAACWG